MLKIYGLVYKYDESGGTKVTHLLNKTEIISISPHNNNKNICVVVYKKYPGTTSHWQGALSVSTDAVTTYQSLEEVMAQFSM